MEQMGKQNLKIKKYKLSKPLSDFIQSCCIEFRPIHQSLVGLDG